jgi:hypothetical protein
VSTSASIVAMTDWVWESPEGDGAHTLDILGVLRA